MPPDGPSLDDWVTELRRRKVVRVAAVYAGVGFVLVQAAAYVFDALLFPEWAHRLLVVLVLLGFPVALVLAWALELTPEGVQFSTRSGRGEAGGPEGSADGDVPPDRSVPEPGSGAPGPGSRALVPVALVAVFGTAVAAAGWGAWETWLAPDASRSGAGAEAEAAEAGLPATRIAVLYFDDHSEAQDLGPVARGLTEALIHELSAVEGLSVVSRNGVKPFRNPDVSLDSLARILGAGSLVGGSVERSGQRLRVHVQLIDGVSGTQIASERLTREGSDVLALRDDMVTEVARLLRKELGEAVNLRAARAETESDEAWRLYHRARELVEFGDSLRLAVDTAAAGRIYAEADSVLARAEALTGDWTAPTVARARVAYQRARLAGGGVYTAFDTVALRSGIAHADRALEEDPESAPALEARGMLRRTLSKILEGEAAQAMLDGAETDFRRAVSLDPQRARAWAYVGDVYRDQGLLAEARMAIRRAWETDPFLTNERAVLFMASNLALDVGDVELAVRLLEQGRRRFPSNPAFDGAYLVALAGESPPPAPPDTERRLLRAVESRIPGGSWPEGKLLVAAVLAGNGLADSAHSVVRRLPEEARAGQFGTYYEANFWLRLGDRERALEHIDDYLEMFPDRRVYVASDAWWKPLRGDDRFRELVSGGPEPAP